MDQTQSKVYPQVRPEKTCLGSRTSSWISIFFNWSKWEGIMTLISHNFGICHTRAIDFNTSDGDWKYSSYKFGKENQMHLRSSVSQGCKTLTKISGIEYIPFDLESNEKNNAIFEPVHHKMLMQLGGYIIIYDMNTISDLSWRRYVVEKKKIIFLQLHF